ncbi:hypothetical protein LXA43DRAFT_1089161 [Ganoderma leucocontextum]|nr:hypothetical protein LXA43DRAFT_1089161 [Ganoderma leucocontextum]
MPFPPTQPERTRSLLGLDLDSLSFTDALSNQSPPTPRYIVVSWADALVAQGHGWDPRIYSDPLPSGSSTPYPLPDDQCRNATLVPIPPMDTEESPGPLAPAPGREINELPPGTHSSSSILLHDPFPHHQNTGPWFASRGGTPIGDRSYDVEFYSSAPSSPRPGADGDSANNLDLKMHRTRPAIALDPTQPPRVDGKPRERVYAACERCRVRKLRCDGAQPTCYNCQRAADKLRCTKGGGGGGAVQCAYPSGPPKRRGADKTQRIRSPIGQRRPRQSTLSSGKRRAEREGTVSASESANDGGDASGSLPGTPDD